MIKPDKMEFKSTPNGAGFHDLIVVYQDGIITINCFGEHVPVVAGESDIPIAKLSWVIGALKTIQETME